MSRLLQKQEFSHFGLIGSGVQRKVDRLTLGVQTVCKVYFCLFKFKILQIENLFLLACKP